MRQKGSVYETAGAYDIPGVWGGARYVYVSLLDDDGNPVPFLNERNEEVHRQLVTSVEFGFEKASSYQRSMVKQIETPAAPLTNTEKNRDNYLPVFNANNTVFAARL